MARTIVKSSRYPMTFAFGTLFSVVFFSIGATMFCTLTNPLWGLIFSIPSLACLIVGLQAFDKIRFANSPLLEFDGDTCYTGSTLAANLTFRSKELRPFVFGAGMVCDLITMHGGGGGSSGGYTTPIVCEEYECIVTEVENTSADTLHRMRFELPIPDGPPTASNIRWELRLFEKEPQAKRVIMNFRIPVIEPLPEDNDPLSIDE